MQDEGGAKKVNPMLERHWEKLVLGVVAALAILYLGTRFTGPGDVAAKSVDRVAANFQAKKNQSNSKSEAPKAMPDHVVPPPVAANRAPDFTVGMKTKFEYNVIDAPPPTPVKFVFPAVTLATPVAKPDGVEISWTLGEVTIDPADRNKPIAVPRATFVWKVERRKKGGDWETLEPKLKTEFLKYHDGKALPKMDYEYKLTLGSNDPPYTKVNPSGWSDKVAGPIAVQTLGIWYFSFNNMISYPDEDPPKPGQVYVTIRKNDRTHGLVEWRKIHLEGDFLGVVKEGGVERSTHTVTDQKGKMVVVDFKCGGKILKITTDKMVAYTYKVCNPKFNANNILECKGPEEVKAHYRVNEVKFTDEDGKVQTEEQPAGPGKIADKLCPDHGGAPPPKELTAEEKAAAKAKEAEILLEEADVLWNKGTPEDQKKAQQKYKTLIERFKDVEPVKSRLKELTERIKKKFE